MSNAGAPKIAKWPFLMADIVFLVLAAAVVNYGFERWQWWQAAFAVVCCLAGAWLCVMPFLKEHEAEVRFAESNQLVTTVGTIRNVEQVATQITIATNQWQSALDQSTQTVAAANEIAQRMTEEARSFQEFMQKANDTEKSHLRLEVEKLRRAEGEWLQVQVRTLDHVFALYLAGQRSGQPALSEQLSMFQNACRDTARRVGLVAIQPAPGDAFDPQVHQLLEDQQAPSGPAVIGEIVATGFSFQGRLIRPVIVRLQPPVEASTMSTSTSNEPQLL